MGGQTALNCAMDLYEERHPDKYDVELIGASPEAIDKAEDRLKFKEAMTRIGLAVARSGIAHSLAEALTVQEKLGFPAVIRPSFTLGGTGGGIAYNMEEFVTICQRGLDLSPTRELLIEESLIGWKEYETGGDARQGGQLRHRVLHREPGPDGHPHGRLHHGRAGADADRQGIPADAGRRDRDPARDRRRDRRQRTCSSSINPRDGRMVVIEMNPRVSRSSALASKATGFPIAKIAAKLAIGYTLDELRNEITGGTTPASFEPTIDYVVVKIPRFAFEKFPQADHHLTTQMKSVGEVMAIGRTFQESLQKALRGLEVGSDGLDEHSTDRDEIVEEIGEPGPNRIWFVGDAFRIGMTLSEVFEETAIDPWFLAQIEELVQIEGRLKGRTLADLSADEMRFLKRKGFSDRRLGTLLSAKPMEVRGARLKLGVRPVYKRVDTCAAEFATTTAYMYSTYEDECEANPTDRKKVIVLGGGPNRIGQGIEFDYCCVHAAFALRDNGFETIMVNCNPETVSTDYDTSDRLYFEPLTLEDVLEIVDREKPYGVIVQYGGQTPLKLARDLEANGVPIIGTSPDSIDIAEDRERFQKLLRQLDLKQPPNRTARAEDEALRLAEEIGYPLVVRPSYVLGGRAMEIVHDPRDLERYMREAVKVSNDSPVLLDRFLDDAIEVDVDCLCDGERVLIGGVMEHIEQAGVHSGDSACSLPPYSLPPHADRRTAQADRADGAGAEGRRPDERAVRHPEAGRRGDHLRAGGQPARVAYGALRIEGDRHAPGEDRGVGDGGPHARPAGRGQGDRAAVFLRQGSGVPLFQVPGRRSAARAGDALHRGGDGRRHHVRRSALQVAAGRRHVVAGQGYGLPEREGR